MVFSMLVSYVPLIQMFLARNTLGFDQTKSVYQIVMAKIVLTALIIVFLFMMDVVFMLSALVIGTIVKLLKFVTCGRVTMEYEELENNCFKFLFDMTKNDIEGFRKSRGIS